jgi:hypothetical protein
MPEPTPTPAPEPTPQPTPGGVTLEQIGSLIDAKLNGLDKRYSKEFKTIQDRLGAPNPEPTPSPEPNPNPNPNPADPKTRQLEAQMRKLQEQLDGEKKARETAETRGRNADRDRAVQQALSGFQFADAAAAKDAFELHRGAVKWSEDGVLLGPDDQPLDDWIKASMGTKQYLLAPREVGGSGSRKAGGHSAGRPFTLDDIDKISTLSAEDQTKLRQQIALSLGAAQSGQ